MSAPSEAEVAESIPDSSLNALQQGTDLDAETKKTTHLILGGFDSDRRGIEILHKDLFDLDSQVVCSALEALERLGDPRSLRFIARLLTGSEEEIRAAAVRAFGKIGHPKAAKVLLDLYKIAKDEQLRLTILEALVEIRPSDGNVLNRIKEYSRSNLVKPDTRRLATALLIRSQPDVDLSALLEGAKDDIVETVLTAAVENEQFAERAFWAVVPRYQRLSAAGRCLMVDLAAKISLPPAVEILRQGLGDLDSSVRRKVYDQLGEHAAQNKFCGPLITCLSERADPDPNLEEEALFGIQRLERVCEPGSINAQLQKRILDYVEAQFKTLSTPERRVGSDSHELGWLISRSKEYLEYYGDEDFRQALLHYLKGSGYYSQDKILSELKATAVKVEVRHFDGYRALVDIIKTPKKPGIGLISRELAIAKLGKRASYYELIRALRLTRLMNIPGTGGAARLFLQIFAWAKENRMFRLGEAALYALSKLDTKATADACVSCLQPPVFSKICAIGAIRLLKELDWKTMEPAAARLLSASEDPHVLLNLVDALTSAGLPASGEIVKSMVSLLLTGEDQELVNRVAEFLASQSAFNVFESIIEGFERAESWRQKLILTVLERQILKNRVSNQEGMVEFLYRILRTEDEQHKSMAAVLLWRLGDDYAGKVVKETMIGASREQQIDILHSISGSLVPEFVPALLPLLRCGHPALQEALRECLMSAEERQVRARICDLALAVRGHSGLEAELEEDSPEVDVQVELFREKKAYRFEREYVQELAVLFTDIQGYSKKAQALTTMQLTALIHDYEGILLPIMTNHRGELIKKMGDGHLVVFPKALDAVLAAVRVQKALKRFNSYREQDQRVVIRIGIHWGKVVRKEGDVIGNHVNIASRMESSAKGGSVLVSEALQQRLGGYVHCREVGLINVKGISEPIKAYEPYEIVVDFPPELDPLKSRQSATRDSLQEAQDRPKGEILPGERHSGNGNGKAIVLDREILSSIVDTFSCLNELCRRAEAKEIQVAEIRKELGSRWRKIHLSLKEGGSL